MNKTNIDAFAAFKWFLLYLLLLLLIISGVYFFLYFQNKDTVSDVVVPKSTNLGKILYSVQKPDAMDLFIYDESTEESARILDSSYVLMAFFNKAKKIIVSKDNQLFVYNLDNNSLEAIPFLIPQSDEYVSEISSVIPGLKQQKAIITVRKAKQKNPNEIDVTSQEFLFDVEKNEVSDLTLNKQSQINFLQDIINFDDQKDIIYSFANDIQNGCQAPVKKYEMKKNTALIQNDFEAINDYCPSFNNYLTEFILLPKKPINNSNNLKLFNSLEINEQLLDINLDLSIQEFIEDWSYDNLVWSYGDRVVYFSKGPKVYKLDIDGQKTSSIFTADKEINNYFMTISFNDQYLYLQNRQNDDNYNLTRINLEKNEKSILVTDKYYIYPIGYFN